MTQELALDFGDRLRARDTVELLGENLVVCVEVAQVVRGHDPAEVVEQPPGRSDRLGDLVAVVGQQTGKHIAPVEKHAPHPGEVVEADLVDDDALRLDAQPAGPMPLEADRNIAEADRLVAVVEQGARDDSDGIREVHDPRVIRELAHALGDVEDDRHRAQRLREPASAGRLLADAAAEERRSLVAEPRRLAAHPDLDENEVGAFDGALEIIGDLQRAGVVLPSEHPAREAADHVAAFRVDVVQHELGDVEPRQTGDELRRVGRAAADDGDLHQPFTPVSVTPSTNALCARKKRMITGAITSSVAAIVRFHCTWWNDRNWASPIESTQLSEFSPT